MKKFSLRWALASVLLLNAAEPITASAHAPTATTNLKFPQSREVLTISSDQSQTITGTVRDSRGPLPGVTVAVKGKSAIAISDIEGKFAIDAQPGDVLVFHLIGYKPFEQTLTDLNSLEISLDEDATALQEVTVNAGYYTVKDKERTGSISKITAKDIENQPVTNALAAMQGRMAGVDVVQTTGTPGGGFDIRIRGQNSLRTDANAPLYIIDGVPYASDPIGSTSTSNIFTSSTSPLNSINPEAIESVEILKDADATAIYGSRGANGVVLITTKKGKAGKTKFTVGATTGTGKVTQFMDLMNTQQYLAMREKAFANDGIEPGTFDHDLNGNWDRDRYTDWQKVLVGGTAEMRDVQGTVTGGSERTQYMLGGNFSSQTTVFPGDFKYRKGGSYLTLNHRSENDKLKLSVAANYVAQNNHLPAFDFTVSSRTLAPNAPELYDEEGNLNWANSTWINPLSNLKAQYRARTNDLVGNGTLSYSILPSLQAKVSAGYTDTRHKETRIAPSTMNNPAWNMGPSTSASFLSTTDRRSWIAEPQLMFEKELAGGTLNLLAGATFQQQTSDRLVLYGTNFTSNSLIYNIAAAATKQVTLSDQTVYKYQAFFGRANYNFRRRYILNLTGRRDGSSRFGPGNRYSTFGAVGAAWIFSNEDFLKDNKILSFGKLRMSYGTSGSDQIGDYQYLDTYVTAGNPYQGGPGLEPARLYNPDFGWETNRKLEASLELGFLNDRIFFTAGHYRNRSSNQLVGIPLPATTGFTSIQANLQATVENTGWELTMRTINFTRKDFKWSSNLNLTLPRNELISFPNLEGSTFKERYRIGQPLNIALVYNYTGIDPETGLYQFEDVDGDGTITSPADKQTVVDLNPRYFGGLQNTLTYKRLTLDFLFQFVKQQNRAFTLGTAGQLGNQPSRLMDSWQQPGDNAAHQLYTTGVNGAAVLSQSQYDESDASIVDASYVRLKNISLGYDLPLLEKSMQARILVQAQNLLTFTPYKDGDPEFTLQGFLPPLRIISAGVQLTF